jgi:hypothetical protein
MTAAIDTRPAIGLPDYAGRVRDLAVAYVTEVIRACGEDTEDGPAGTSLALMFGQCGDLGAFGEALGALISSMTPPECPERNDGQLCTCLECRFTDIYDAAPDRRGAWRYLGLRVGNSYGVYPVYQHVLTGERVNNRPAGFVDIPENDLSAKGEFL